ncbi:MULTISPECIES: hypothetical protein [Streptomyces]|nr:MULTISPECIES: hypothetical protein [Streptomyces]AZK94700.1 hypothetical protein B7R87_13110 [Streptomyces tsukubensis]MYS63881.1 hypothetical protein [Streptomyces sp. SID5473]TAI42853.1 hypothetical protein EWI31_20875 [Streptomyces tsukubensis]
MPEFNAQRWQEMFGIPPSESVAPAADEVSMTLASAAPLGPGGTGSSAAPGNGGGGLGRLLHGSTPWRRAATAADGLRMSADQGRRALGSGHRGIEQGNAGLGSVPVLKAVLVSWEERVASVRDECAYLGGALLRVADDLSGVDLEVERSMGSSARMKDENR